MQQIDNGADLAWVVGIGSLFLSVYTLDGRAFVVSAMSAHPQQ